MLAKICREIQFCFFLVATTKSAVPLFLYSVLHVPKRETVVNGDDVN